MICSLLLKLHIVNVSFMCDVYSFDLLSDCPLDTSVRYGYKQ